MLKVYFLQFFMMEYEGHMLVALQAYALCEFYSQ